jgi:hypothetical protein
VKSVRNLRTAPAGVALVADDLLEFHAARLLLLVRVCGTSNRIDGLTKLAKLDFFVRYPSLFVQACRDTGQAVPAESDPAAPVEAPMVRHHYGPWDKRYYRVLAFLEGARLLEVTPQSNGSYRFRLTDDGLQQANQLAAVPAFAGLVRQMRAVKTVFGAKSGDTLKKLIYRVFDAQVGRRLLGEVIR